MSKILVVDDSQETRRLVRHNLANEGYTILEAENGITAMQIVERFLPDVILLDIMMPDMTGFEVCKKLRSNPKFNLAYIIMLTAVTGSKNKVMGLDLGADDYIIKPFNVEELMARIRVGLKAVSEKKGAIIDPLTNLYNKGFFETYLAQEVMRSLRYRHPLSLIMIDLDHFKVVNDTYGHLSGDRVLNEVASVLIQNCRQSDVVARWGGEEFAVLLPETLLKGAKLLAERLRERVYLHEFEKVGRLTVSMGLAALEEGLYWQDLLQNADRALYHAKNNGRNRVESIENLELSVN